MTICNFNRSPLESNLQNKVEKYIKTTFKQRAWFLKVAGSAAQRSGVPDIICLIDGHFVALELKREDGSGKPSQQQIIECEKIRKAGGTAIITNDFNEIKNLLNSLVKNTQ